MNDAEYEDPRDDEEIHAEAIERFGLGMSAIESQLSREIEDLKFQVPELQWDEAAKAARMGGKIGNLPIPARPMLSIPKLSQPIRLILNQERAAHIGVNIAPVSEKADQATAEMLQEHYRQIEVDSRAHIARSWAFQRAVLCGRGAYRVLTEYDPYAPSGSKDQRIVIKRLLFQESAVLDPFSEEPDGSDAEWGFIYQWMPWSRYKLQTRNRKTSDDRNLKLWDFGPEEMNQLVRDKPLWAQPIAKSKDDYLVLLVEYFSRVIDDEGKYTMMWRKMNAVEFTDVRKWPGRYVPIVPVIGEELIPFDDERRYQGIIYPNRDAQRFHNFSASAVAEVIGQEPKATWQMAEGQEEGHEQEYLLANIRNLPYLRYKPKMVDGELAPPPARIQADTSKLSLGLQALAMADSFIHAGTGAYAPTLGQESSQVKSGRQALAMQQQHEQGNSNWLDNLAQVAVQHEACIVLDLINAIYDRPGRVVRTRSGENNKTSRAMINQPYVMQGGQMQRVDPAALPQGVAPENVKHYRLGDDYKFGITVTVGKAYKSSLEEGTAGLGQLFEAEPELFKLLGDIWLGFQSWPGHKEAQKRMQKMLPPQLQEQGEDADPAMQLQQAKMQMQQMQQQLQEMQKALETDKVKADAQIEVAKIAAFKEAHLKELDNAGKIAVAQINAAAKGVQLATEAENEAQALGRQHAFDERQAALDRQHEQAQIQAQQAHDASMGAADAATAGAESERDRAHEAAIGAQGHAAAMEQGDQANQAAQEQAEQQAALQPPAEGE